MHAESHLLFVMPVDSHGPRCKTKKSDVDRDTALSSQIDRCHLLVRCHFIEVLPASTRHMSVGIVENVLHFVRTFFRFERDYRDTTLVDYRDDTKRVD